jgi:hypothetical protein
MRDFLTFDEFITPRVIQVLFLIGLVLIAVGLIGGLISMVAYSFWQGLVSIITLLASVLLWRVYCELIMVFFDIRAKLQTIAERPRV